MRGPMAVVLTGIATAACSVVGVRDGTEEPQYIVQSHVGGIEIRAYGPRLAAETTLDDAEEAARGAGFRRLAGYIFGANSGRAKIAMTAPVSQSSLTIDMTAPVAQSQDMTGRWVIRFFMPARYTMAGLPKPDDTRVRLVEVPPETIGVLRFTGSTAAYAVAAKRRELLLGLEGSAWRPISAPIAWFYDSPWTIPFLRRNEVAVVVNAEYN